MKGTSRAVVAVLCPLACAPSNVMEEENEMAVRAPWFGLRSFLAGIAVAASIGAVPVAARASDVTQEIDAEVFSVSGDYASFFDGADRVVGSLTYDDAVADSNPAPDTGTYLGALVFLTATIPGLGFTWSADAGNVSAFPDTISLGDQFSANSFINNPTGYPINGYPIKTFGVTFFGGDLNLLGSDALPGPGARYEDGNLSLGFQDEFGMIVGQAVIAFAPEPGRSSAALAAFAGLALAARWGRLVVPLAEAKPAGQEPRRRVG